MRLRGLHFPAPVLLLSVLFCVAASGQEVARPELVLQSGHSDWADVVAFSPDERWLATASWDHTICLWETRTGRQLRKITGHQAQLDALTISPDGKWLASGDRSGRISVWDAVTGREIRRFHTGAFIRDLDAAFARQPLEAFLGKTWLAAASDDGVVRVFDVTSGALLHAWRADQGHTNQVLFVPGTSYLVSAGDDHVIRVFSTATGRQIAALRGGDISDDSSIYYLAISGDGRRLASVTDISRAVTLWDLEALKEIETVHPPHTQSIRAIALNRDGSSLMSDDFDNNLIEWDIAAGQVKSTVKAGANSLRFSPTGRMFAIAVGNGAYVWDMNRGKLLHRLSGQADSLRSLALNAQNRTLVTASGLEDEAIHVWDLTLGAQIARRPTFDAGASEVRFTGRDRFLIATGGIAEYSNLKVWDTGTWAELRHHPEEGTGSSAVDPRGRYLASVGRLGQVTIWDAAASRVIVRLPHLPDYMVDELAFAPDGKTLAVASEDINTRVDLFSVPGWAILRTILIQGSAGRLAFSPKGGYLALVTEKGIALYDGSGSRLLRRLSGGSVALNVAFSPDDRRLASAGLDGQIRVWGTADGKPVVTLEGHAAGVTEIAFTSDGKRLISTSSDGTCRIWDLASGQQLATLVVFVGSDDWAAITPDGLFDGSPGAWQKILWRFDNNTFDVAPVETFFQEYYYPGLLADILAGKRPQASTDIAKLDRRQPRVELSLAAGQQRAGIAARRVNVKVEVEQAPADAEHAAGSGVRDVRLFRNGSLVKIFHGDVLQGKASAQLEAEVTLVAGENKLAAYAFNHDNIKSPDATLTLTGADSLQRPGTAYVLAIGINQYADQDFNLRYAVADAQDFANEIEQQQKKLGRYAKVEITSLEDARATKANLLAALKHLAEVAQPEDAVFLYYAGHGTAAGPRFYLIPHDLGYAGRRNELDEAAVKAVLAHSVSDLELDEAFEAIDAGEIVLVIDACRSGQALQADDPRQGPMNSKGLAQLAYEKGMYILTASQGYQAALEASSYGHGLLTYALVEEGLKSAKADGDPRDGQVTLREWLDYASQEVPQLELELMQAAQKRGMDIAIVEGEQKVDEVEKRSLQRPRVFYRREPEPTPFVVAKP